MAEKHMIMVVEGTKAMRPYWPTVLSDVEKIIRSLRGNELSNQMLSTSTVAMSLVIFNTSEPYCGCLVQRSGWTRDTAIFLQWLSAIPLVGGGSSDAAVAEGLSEALMMFSTIQSGSKNQQNVDFQKHCILVAASNPHPLPTQMQNVEQSENCDAQTESRLYDAEAVAKSFAQFFVSLSVIGPKLPILRAIYNAGKCNPRAADPPIDNVKNPHFLVLISENFIEARATLSHPGISQQAQSGIESQETSVALRFAQSNFVKFWTGKLCGQDQGQPICFVVLHGYSRSSASERIAANWPETLQLHKLISHDQMYNKYVRLDDILLFRAAAGGFARILRERKLGAVIKLPSHNLLLSLTDRDTLMIGMLLPLDVDPMEPYIGGGRLQMYQQLALLRAATAAPATTNAATAASATTNAATAAAATTDAEMATVASTSTKRA